MLLLLRRHGSVLLLMPRKQLGSRAAAATLKADTRAAAAAEKARVREAAASLKADTRTAKRARTKL